MILYAQLRHGIIFTWGKFEKVLSDSYFEFKTRLLDFSSQHAAHYIHDRAGYFFVLVTNVVLHETKMEKYEIIRISNILN